MHSQFDIPEADARALLARPLRCEDCGGWRRGRTHPSTLKTVDGLVDGAGACTDMYVELACRPTRVAIGLNTGMRHYVFSVYWRNLGRVNRVYQLDIGQAAQHLIDLPPMPHEHFGDRMILGEIA